MNPLELVKTKIQLQNDEEIIRLATEKANAAIRADAVPNKPISSTKQPVGTTQVIQSLIEVRGPFSLFQSADITFLTSVVFGIFGFGATELFRRSFSTIFFSEDGGGNEFVLLAAAAFATLLTCAAGAPWEILRVRSMSTVESKSVKEVFFELVVSYQGSNQLYLCHISRWDSLNCFIFHRNKTGQREEQISLPLQTLLLRYPQHH